MIIKRCPAFLLSLMLGACSPDLPGPSLLPEAAFVPPAPPTDRAIVDSASKLATDVKLAGPLQISAPRPTDHGPGGYYVCLREANPPPDKRPRYYAVFFDSDSYKGERLSVILDQCETQTFTPLPVAAPVPVATKAKPAGHKTTRSSPQ